MIILPAIDLYDGCAVRLLRGDYNKMTIYDKHPEAVAQKFEQGGATHIHIVDLEGAKTGNTPNLETVKRIVSQTGLSAEIGGGVRSMSVIDAYVNAGVDRVILGTAAVTDDHFLKEAIKQFGDKIVVGVDIKDGFVAIRGWMENSAFTYHDFCDKMASFGVKTLICTDISKDGAMEGTNLALYEQLTNQYDMNIIASGGVSSLDDILALSKIGVYGAILGKAYYTGAVTIPDAVAAAAESVTSATQSVTDETNSGGDAT